MFERYLFPFVFAIFTNLLLVIIKNIKRSDWKSLAFLSIYLLCVFLPSAREEYSWVSGYRVAMKSLNGIAASFVNAKIGDRYKSYAGYDAGYIPYRSGWNFIDLQGLTTPEVTHTDVNNVIQENQPTVLIVSSGAYRDPTTIKIYSQYQPTLGDIPSNYHFVSYIQLNNDYWWKDRPYGYYIFVNENASVDLVEKLRKIDIVVDKEIGYQKPIFTFLSIFSIYRII
jgi:hypothetical protein